MSVLEVVGPRAGTAKLLECVEAMRSYAYDKAEPAGDELLVLDAATLLDDLLAIARQVRTFLGDEPLCRPFAQLVQRANRDADVGRKIGFQVVDEGLKQLESQLFVVRVGYATA